MKQMLQIMTFTLFFSQSCWAEQFIEYAEVIDSAPIISQQQTSQLALSCMTSKPASNDLKLLLDWDLGIGHCVIKGSRETITGYRVRYRWDGQVFNTVMAEQPGNQFPIEIRLQ